MTLFALGINHNTASVELRERLAYTPEQLGPAMRSARDRGEIDEIAILSTCNRTEIYCACPSELEGLLEWMAQERGVEVSALLSAHYLHRDESAARHMMAVASGLDSLVLGEPQILGQMKSCYSLAREQGTVGSTLHGVFQQVFGVAKRVRSETAIGENPVSVAYAAVALAQRIFSNLKNDVALLIGAGETIELVARHLAEQGIGKMLVANRTLSNALRLAEQFDGHAMLLSDIPDSLHEADIVISSTASSLPILGKGAVERALKKRKHKPMFMVDIAVPRDIEPEVNDLSDVFLYTVDDLRDVIDENKRSREQAAEIARDIIEEGVEQFRFLQRSAQAVSMVKRFRRHMENVREEELLRAQKMLASGVAPEEALASLARGLSNKYMHTPSIRVKHAGAEGRDDVVEAMRFLFSLDPDNDALP